MKVVPYIHAARDALAFAVNSNAAKRFAKRASEVGGLTLIAYTLGFRRVTSPLALLFFLATVIWLEKAGEKKAGEPEVLPKE